MKPFLLLLMATCSVSLKSCTTDDSDVTPFTIEFLTDAAPYQHATVTTTKEMNNLDTTLIKIASIERIYDSVGNVLIVRNYDQNSQLLNESVKLKYKNDLVFSFRETEEEDSFEYTQSFIFNHDSLSAVMYRISSMKDTVGIFEYKINKNKNITDEIEFDGNYNFIASTHYKYDDTIFISKKVINENKQLEFEFSLKYQNHQITKVIIKKLHNNKRYHYHHLFLNNFKEIEKEIIMNDQGELVNEIKCKYTYDSKKNWIEINILKDGKPYKTLTRELLY